MTTKIAIDIGKKGGYCIYSKDSIKSYGEIDTSSVAGMSFLSLLIKENDIKEVVFEKPFGVAGNKNMNTFINYGRIQSVPMLLNIPFSEVVPKTWVSMYKGIGSNKKKHSLKAIHILERNNIEFDADHIIRKDGIADAILIANYKRLLAKHTLS